MSKVKGYAWCLKWKCPYLPNFNFLHIIIAHYLKCGLCKVFQNQGHRDRVKIDITLGLIKMLYKETTLGISLQCYTFFNLTVSKTSLGRYNDNGQRHIGFLWYWTTRPLQEHLAKCYFLAQGYRDLVQLVFTFRVTEFWSQGTKGSSHNTAQLDTLRILPGKGIAYSTIPLEQFNCQDKIQVHFV